MKNRLRNHKNIICLSMFAGILICIWILPIIKATNLTVEIKLEDGHDNEEIEWIIKDEDSYVKTYTQESYVYGDRADIYISSEFTSIDAIEASDEGIFQEMKGITVYAGNHSDVKYQVASYNGSCTEEKMIDLIAKGYKNPWMTRVEVSLVFLFVFFCIYLYKMLSRKFSKTKAAGVIITFGITFGMCIWINMNHDDFVTNQSLAVSDQKILISDGTIITQKLYPARNNLHGIGVYLQREGDANCDVILRITKESDGEILQQKVISANEIDTNGSFVNMTLNKNIKDLGGSYEIAVYGVNGDGQETVYAYTCDTATDNYGRCLVNAIENKTYLTTQLQYIKFYNVELSLCLIGMFSLFVVLSILFAEDTKYAKIIIISGYICILLFSVFKMLVYERYVANTPDETEHIAYIAYLESTGEILPDYQQMKSAEVISNDNHIMELRFKDATINYLGHSPVYYHLMRLAHAVQIHENGTITVNVWRLRCASMAIMIVTLLLLFYIGFTRLPKIPYIHLLYGVICTCVPMFLYTASGINNDTLSAFAVTVFFLGILRFTEKRRSLLTYLLIAAGIALAFFSKLTAGCIVAFAALVVLVCTCIRERSVKSIKDYRFLVTIPVYALVGVYYLYIHKCYGSFQPDIFHVNEAHAINTEWYVHFVNRTFVTPAEYIRDWLKMFSSTWTGILSHLSLVKTTDVQNIEISSQTLFYNLLWFIPIAVVIYAVKKKDGLMTTAACGYIGIILTLAVQFCNNYSTMFEKGRFGGMQSRYYLCAIVIFALAPAQLAEKAYTSIDMSYKYGRILRTLLVSSVLTIASCIFYNDFIYFILNYTQWLD